MPATALPTKSHRDLLIDGAQITDDMKAWKIAEHPHAIIGTRRGFEVRMYHDPEWPEPYFVTLIGLQSGWIMGSATTSTAAAARTEAIAMLAMIDGGTPAIGTA